MKRTMRIALLSGLVLVVLLAIACGPPPAAPALTPVLPDSTVPAAPPTVQAMATLTPVPPVPTATAAPTTVQPSPAPAELVWKITGDPNPFSKPIGVAVDGEGNVYVVDVGNSRVEKFDRNGKFLLMWGSKGSGDGQFDIFSKNEGRAAVDGQGNLYVVDSDNQRIQKFDSSGKFLLKWGSQGEGEGQFGLPADIAMDPQNNVYVSDIGNDTIQKFDSNGKFLLRWGSHGSANGNFNFAISVALDGQGSVLVADYTGRLQKFDSSGKFISKYTLPPVASTVLSTWSIALDSQGNIYVADHSAYRIVKLDSNGNLLAVWGKQGSGAGQFQSIQDVAVDNEGNVYVTDELNKCVYKFRQPRF